MALPKMELKTKILKPYKPAFNGNKRYYLIAGGRAGGRSYFASQYAYISLLTKEYFRCAIMRFVQGDIKDSIKQEIIDRLEEKELDKYIIIKENRIEYGSNKIIPKGFRKSSSDQKAKLKSLAGYTDVIIEEAEEVSEEDFIQLDDSLRTVKGDIRIFLLFNMPPKDHWINKRFFNLVESDVEDFYKVELKDSVKHNTEYVFSDYRDNIKNLDKTTVNNFENYKITNPDHYWNMIRGYVPSGKRGLIFKNWLPITAKEFEDLPYTSFFGLDFGFTNDPTALVEIKTHNDKVWIRELIYQTGLTNEDISVKMENLGVSKDAYIYYDSAEPKSGEDLRRLGWNAEPCIKGAGSINAGVSKLLEKKIFYTEDSSNVIKEKENYCWALDREKNPTNNPIDEFNHCFAGNSLVHTTKGKKQIKDLVGKEGYLYSINGSVQKYSNVRPTRKKAETLKLEFTDGNILEVTPDHLLLKPDGTWIEAGLLDHKDMIQSVIYENTNIQWTDLQTLQWGKLLQQGTKKITQSCLGILQWRNSKRNAYTSQRWEQGKQLNKKSRINESPKTYDETYDAREKKKTERMGRKNTTSYKEMAQIKRGQRVAQIEWYRNIQEKKTYKERMRSLPQRIYNYTICKISPFLSSELQNESKNKEIKRITRGFCDVVYNMDVENTECLLVNGVIAHNCMDAIRYGVYTDDKQLKVGFY